MVKTITAEVTKDLYLIRLNDDEVKYFEALWYMPEGITYNAYVLTSHNKIVLFDTWKRTYSNIFIETLSEIVDVKDIDYMVIHHVKPDHNGRIPKVLEVNKGKAEIWGHPLAKNMLESFYNVKPKFK